MKIIKKQHKNQSKRTDFLFIQKVLLKDSVRLYPEEVPQYFFPLFSGFLAVCIAAHRAAPLEIPTRIPSDFANFFQSQKRLHSVLVLFHHKF